MMLPKVGALVCDWSIGELNRIASIDSIACIALPVPPPDLEVPPPATAHCGLIQIVEGGSLI